MKSPFTFPETHTVLPDPLAPEAFVQRRATRLLADDTAQASLQRRSARPEAIDQAVKTGAVMDAEGKPAQLTVSTSMQNLAAAEGHIFRRRQVRCVAQGPRASQSEQRIEGNGAKYDIDGNGGTLYLGAGTKAEAGLILGLARVSGQRRRRRHRRRRLLCLEWPLVADRAAGLTAPGFHRQQPKMGLIAALLRVACR